MAYDEELANRVRALVGGEAGLDERRMFGGLAMMLNGNIAVVVRGKGAREDRLPLPVDVGEAVAAYLKRGRPSSQRRELFLGARAPFTPIASGTVRSTVRRACRRAGIAEIGAHRLRHTAACEMIAAQVPLVQIAGVLRHESLQSTALYARLDLDQLRRVAAPWPAGGSR